MMSEIQKPYIPDLVVGAAIRDSSGKVIDKRFKQAYDDLDKEIVGTISGSSLVVTLKKKSEAEDIPKEEPQSSAKPSGFSLEEEEPEEASFPVAQSKQTGGFTFTQQEEPKETTFSLSSAKPSGGFNFSESDSSNSFSLGGSKVSATGFEIKIS